MKKIGVVLSVFVLILFMSSFVFAQTDLSRNINGFIDDVTQTIEPVASKLLGETYNGKILFARLLFFILVLTIIILTLKSNPLFHLNSFALWTIGIIVAYLGVRYFDSSIIEAILLPYNTLAIAFTAAIPFLIYFAVVEVVESHFSSSGYLRKFAWIFFAVIFTGLWLTRSTEIKGPAEWIYPVTVLLSILMIVFDGTIHRMIIRMRIERGSTTGKQAIEEQLLERLNKLNDLHVKDIISESQYKSRSDKIKKKLAKLYN